MKKQLANINVKRTGLVVMILFTIGMMSFIIGGGNEKLKREVALDIDYGQGHKIVDQEALLEKIKGHKIWQSAGSVFDTVPVIERELLMNPYIKEAEVYMDTGGVLHVKVEQRRMLARVLRNLSPGAFISEDGFYLPVYKQKALQLLLITGAFTDKVITDENADLISGDYLKMLKIIKNDPFLRVQITQLDINADGMITIYPLVGKQKFIFGQVSNYEHKLKNFKYTYEKLFPKKGWGYYKSIDLRFKKQILAK